MPGEDQADGPPDPQLDPTRSPGFAEGVESLADLDVGRDDLTLGEASPADMSAADTDPVADAETDDLLAVLVGGEATERRRAALALGERAAAETVVQALAASARDDPDPEVRQFAVESLADLGADCTPAVAREALADENPWVRAEAVVVLDGWDRERFADVIEDHLDDDNPAVRRNALVSLAKHRDEMVETLCAFADDESERVREWVAELLGEYDDERARSALEMLADDDSDIVAQAAGNALDGSGRRRELFARSQAPSPGPGETPPDL